MKGLLKRISQRLENVFIPKIILYGGRKPNGQRKETRVKKIKRGKRLGGGAEGRVYKIKVVVERGEKRRTLHLVEKKFRIGKFPSQPNIRNPIRQFETMQELLRLNREKKLGLHIIPTIRLRKVRWGKPRLVMTRIKEKVYFLDLSGAEWDVAHKQRRREAETLTELGYYPHSDMWVYTRDPKTRKVTSWIADFGNIRKAPKERKNKKSLK